MTVTCLSKFETVCDLAITESSPTAQYVDPDKNGVRSAGKALCEFVDPSIRLVHAEKWRRPLFILSFDEPHVLTNGAKEGEWSTFSELRRVLQRLDDEYLIFSLFLSTAGDFRFLSPDVKFDPSSRIVNDILRPFHPITDISFDCLAKPAGENSVKLSQVVKMDWIAHLGRPLWGFFLYTVLESCSH